ncbi:MAG: hypothetical protein JW741_29150 [Sedimentisphaerales bacterium]|nr:hypothetical protein [Sedimentisphaerales bacterium]
MKRVILSVVAVIGGIVLGAIVGMVLANMTAPAGQGAMDAVSRRQDGVLYGGIAGLVVGIIGAFFVSKLVKKPTNPPKG